MGQPQTLGRGARTFGAAACALLALLSLAWIVRDATVAPRPGQVWWLWAGSPAGYGGGTVQVTSLTDGLLCLVCGYAALRVPRSPSAAAVLAAAGSAALVLRLPSLWLLGQEWTRLWAGGTLRTLAYATTLVTLLLGVALLVTAALYRRAARTGAEVPPRPERGAALTSGVLLVACAGLFATWEADLAGDYGWTAYRSMLLGSRNTTLSLLTTPHGWWMAALVLLALLGGAGALARARFSRALGTVAAGMVLAWGLVRLSVAVRFQQFDGSLEASPRVQLSLASTLFYVLTGLVVLALLLPRERPGVPAASPVPAPPGA